MITTIIFDFAGVISNERLFTIMADSLSGKFGIDRDEMERRLRIDESAYAVGKQSTEDFWKQTCDGLPISLEDFRTAFNSWTWNEDTASLIEKLKTRYKIVLMSDNFEALSETLRKNERFLKYFDKMYFSNEMGRSKGEVASFQYVLSDLGIGAGDAVFTDDQAKNLVNPESLGIAALLFTTALALEGDLAKLGVV
jgi:FMN phosphatase YigB (HAD superfamily)